MNDYSTRNFKPALKRDRWRCLYCGDPAECVDHITPRCYDESNELDNLASACTACNLAAGGDVFEDFADKAFHILRRRGLLRAFETSLGAYVSAEGPSKPLELKYAERACYCGCGEVFTPRRRDQRYVTPMCRSNHWRATHPAGILSERFYVALSGADVADDSDAPADGSETFSEAHSR